MNIHCCASEKGAFPAGLLWVSLQNGLLIRDCRMRRLIENIKINANNQYRYPKAMINENYILTPHN
jgi:hypothetical protein